MFCVYLEIDYTQWKTCAMTRVNFKKKIIGTKVNSLRKLSPKETIPQRQNGSTINMKRKMEASGSTGRHGYFSKKFSSK